MSAAARAAGVARQYAYECRELKNKAGDELKRAQEFAAAWDDAIEESLDDLESEARRRAFAGLIRKKFTRSGEPIMDPDTDAQYFEYEYSDTLMQFLLRVHRYGDKNKVEITGANGGPLEVRDMEAVRAQRWAQVAPALAAALNTTNDEGQTTNDA